MKIKILLILSIIWSLRTLGQPQNDFVKGIITYQNTGTPIPGVRVHDQNRQAANVDHSEKDGTYLLQYVFKRSGAPIQLQAFLMDHMIINQKEVSRFRIPSDTSNIDDYQIVMCLRSEYDDRYAEYHNTFSRTLKENLEQRISNLEGQLSQQYKASSMMSEEISRLEKEKSALEHEFKFLQDRANTYARKLATIDLSRVGNRRLMAFGAFIKGNIERTISLLNADSLDMDYLQASKQVDKGGEALVEIVESYELLYDAYAAQYDYGNAVKSTQKALAIIKEYPHFFEQDELYSHYKKIAITYRDYLGDYTSAREYLLEGLLSRDNSVSEKESYLATLGAVHNYLGASDTARHYLLLAIQAHRLHRPQYDTVFADTYNTLARVLADAGELDSAFYYQKLAVEIVEYAEEQYTDLGGVTYNNYGLLYLDRNLDSALHYFNKAQLIQEKIYTPNHHLIAATSNNIASALMRLGQIDSALVYQRRTLAIEKTIFHPLHPELGTSNENLAHIFKADHQLDSALYYQKLAVAIREKAYAYLPMHPWLGLTYLNLANIYSRMENFELNQVYTKKALVILEANNSPVLASLYNNIARTFKKRNQLDSALVYQRAAMERIKINFSHNHLHHILGSKNLAEVFHAQNNLDSALYYIQYSLDSLKLFHPVNPFYKLQVYWIASLIYHDVNDLDRAIYFGRRAYIVDPKFDKSHILYDTVNSTLTRIYRSKSNNLMEAGRIIEAIDTLSSALKMFPNNSWFLLDRSRLYAKVQNFQMANEDLDQAYKLNPRLDSLYLIDRSILAIQSREFAKAAQLLEKYEVLYSDHQVSRGVWIFLYLRSDQVQKILPILRDVGHDLEWLEDHSVFPLIKRYKDYGKLKRLLKEKGRSSRK